MGDANRMLRACSLAFPRTIQPGRRATAARVGAMSAERRLAPYVAVGVVAFVLVVWFAIDLVTW